MQEFKIFRAIGLSIKSLFRNFVPFVALSAIVFSPVIVWTTMLPTTLDDGGEAFATFFTRGTYVLIGLSALLSPMLTYRVVEDLNGRRVSMLTSIKYGVRGILPAIILAAVTNVLQLIPAGGLASAVVTCMWFVAAPAAVAEKLGPFAAISRSAEITKGRRWGIFGLTFVIGLAIFGVLAIWIVPIFNMEGETAETVVTTLRHASIAFVAVLCICQMFTSIVQAVSYALLRSDKDGVSHDELSRVFE